LTDQDRAYRPWTVPERGFFVYRAWGADDESLYIGMVGVGGPASLSRRLGQHRHHSEWWPEMLRIDWAELNSEDDASAEEAKQIAEQGPIYNQRRCRHPNTRPQKAEPAEPDENADQVPWSEQVVWYWSDKWPGGWFSAPGGSSSYFDPFTEDAKSEATINRIVAEVQRVEPGSFLRIRPTLVREAVSTFILEERWKA
jgi:hypothetical protein